MMKNLTCLTLALAAGVVAFPVLAAAPVNKLSTAATAAHAAATPSWSSAPHVRLTQPASSTAAGVVKPKVMGTHTDPGTPGPNAFRAYPPSCAADPLPDKSTGTSVSAQVPLFATDGHGNGYTETVTITVWRLPCSSSGAATPYNPNGFGNAITLMRIDRADDTLTSVEPLFPLVQAAQGDNAFTDSSGNPLQISVVRSATEPNTVISEAAYNSVITTSTTYVLENYPYQGSGYFTFSDAFTLRIQPVLQGVAPLDLVIPAYPGSGSSVLPIDGYLSSAWYDPAHGGEGLMVQVLDNPDGVSHTVFAAWYTYDALGLPFWLVAQGVVQPGDTALNNAPVYYYTGGGFSGDFGAQADQHNWGTMSMSFPDCNTIHFSYASQIDAQSGAPGGNGTRDWTRLASVNGLTCE
jgi:hypothetical protein